MPWIVMAPSMTAVTASPGIPKAILVISEPLTLALFDASEAVIPSGCPVPNSCSFDHIVGAGEQSRRQSDASKSPFVTSSHCVPWQAHGALVASKPSVHIRSALASRRPLVARSMRPHGARVGIEVAPLCGGCRSGRYQEPALGRFSVFEARKPCAVASFSHMYAPALVVP
jgi:hypothetical protein